MTCDSGFGHALPRPPPRSSSAVARHVRFPPTTGSGGTSPPSTSQLVLAMPLRHFYIYVDLSSFILKTPVLPVRRCTVMCDDHRTAGSAVKNPSLEVIGVSSVQHTKQKAVVSPKKSQNARWSPRGPRDTLL